MNLDRIDKFIKERRKERDLTQKDLAQYAEVSFTFINRVENGDLNVNFKTLNKVLNIFGYELGPVQIQQNEDKE